MAKTIPGSSETAVSRAARLPYLPALDGLRALAVLAVVAYHAGAKWLPGGFVGVEIFFVISGYLITSLLLAERNATGRINFGQFWLRRARRLLPALFLLLLAVLAVAVLFLPDEVAGLRKDAAAATGYVTNWYLVLSQKSYFESIGRPSLLRHLWSLAVEEQFYLLWPLLFASIFARLRPSRAVWLVLAGAAASAALMFRLYSPDLDPSRVYYGTDTRAAGLLLGAALAFVWAPGRPYLRSRWPRRRLPAAVMLDGLGLLGLALLAGACMRINEYQPSLYRGGFLVVDLATVLVILASVHPDARLLPSLLSLAPLRWIGVRSYGIYLWHWPVFMVTRPQLDVPMSGPPLLALQLAATGVLVAISYHYVETPIRTGALGRAWRTWREARGERRRWLALRWAAGALGFAICFATLGQSIVRAQPPPPPAYLTVQSVQISASANPAPADPGLVRQPQGITPAARPAAGRAPAVAALAAAAATTGYAAETGLSAALPLVGGSGQLLPFCQAEAGSSQGEDGRLAAGNAIAEFLIAAQHAAPTAAAPSALREAEAQRLDRPEHGLPERMPTLVPTPAAPAPDAPTTAPAAAAETAAPVAAATEMAAPAAAAGQAVTATLASDLAAATPAPATATPAEAGSAPVEAAAPVPTPEVTGAHVLAVGDSVMIAAASLLQQEIPNLDLDARLGRQASAAIEFLRTRRDANELGDVVVIHVGNNGTFTARQFDEMMSLLTGVRRVVVVNVKVPRSWEAADNAVLSEGVKRYANAVLLDWRAASSDHPEMFWADAIHLRPEGAQIYANLIAAAVTAP